MIRILIFLIKILFDALREGEKDSIAAFYALGRIFKRKKRGVIMKVKIFSGTNIKVLEDKVNKFGENVEITDIKLSSATDDYGNGIAVHTILVMYEEKGN